MKKILGVCSWSLEPSSCEELVQSLQKCGLSHIQLALDPLVTNQWDLDATERMLDDARISVCSGMMTTFGEDYSSLDTIRATGGLRPNEHWEANKQHAKIAAKVACELGIKLVTYHAGFIPDGESTERSVLIDRIRVIADIFGQYTIQTALETGQESAESLLRLLETPALSGSGIGVNFDPANMILYGMGDPARAIELLSKHIIQVHLKDALPSKVIGSWGTEVVAGEGTVDWEHFFETINSRPVNIPVIIERESGTQRLSDIIEAKKLAVGYGCKP